MDSHEPDKSDRILSPARSALTGRRGLLLLLASVGLAHVAFALLQPTPHPTGDELHYIQVARDDAAHARTWPLPGTLRFGHRPELASRLLAGLVAPGATRAEIVRRAGLLNSLFYLALIAAVFGQARFSGASQRAALIAATSVAAFPWLGFHVHSLWPEIFHAAVFAGALLAALLYLHAGSLWPLALSGLATGFALLAKGSLTPFVPLFAAFFATAEWRRPAAHARATRGQRVAWATAVYLAGVLLVVGPQLAANLRAGHGARLAANTWWNLELGVTLPVDAAAAGVLGGNGQWLPEVAQTERYAAAAPRAAGRESAARARTLEYIAEQGGVAVARAQLAKLLDLWIVAPDLLPQRQASFDQALGPRARWGTPPPAWLAAWQAPGRWAWRLLVPLGLLGLLWGARDSPQRLLLALFAVGFLVAGAAVPVKVRFLLPVVPVLALGVGFLTDRFARLAANAGPAN